MKNYKTIYTSGNASSALEQRFYVKKEVTRGLFVPPIDADFFFTIGGGSINHTQAITPSAHKSGRDNLTFIKEKKVAEFSLPAYFNVDTGVAAGTSELDPAMRVLWESALGYELVSSGVHYNNSAVPAITFTMLECGDMWAKQIVGCFVDSAEISLPGDGQSQVTFAGAGKEAIVCGIAKSEATNAGGNIVTVPVADVYRIPVGAYVMIIKNDGTTRSADTPAGSPRKVTAVDNATGVVTVDGAALTADSDGTVMAPVYLSYYEPASPTAINNPQTGLQGSFTCDLLTIDCVRAVNITLTNNHERVDYCFGQDALGGTYFVPAGRLQVDLSVEINFSGEVLEFYNKIRLFQSADVDVVLGDSATRHVKFELPKVQFNVPEIAVPESGSIPVSFEGVAYATALSAGDALTVKYL
jgi:hypothetical protein